MMKSLSIKQAASALMMGEVIAYPTEAVWGLGCDPWQEEAVHQVLKIKERPIHKGLIIVAANLKQVAPLIDPLSTQQQETLQSSWPGHITWLIPDPNNWLPSWIKGDFTTVAVRVSAHPIVNQLCLEFGKPIVSTSANKAGELPLDAQGMQRLGASLGGIVSGSLGDQLKPSVIKDLASGNVVRQ
ncbi:Sua5/YciO/YrdC/YwlC family protein [Zooshikella sp. RANM57]|uniref:Sua5/YciO/YrdC/YwlC family protein n=1 Tax=Zooshikella sp. RANM57 TaxID=3425863 RepID=UPI003D6DC7F3